ncbi:MAG TPA: maltose alpha-D-glucosyltransferase [Rhizomicrobium sp.]|jgi:maltose alpha-D-glucosyltransferase/alpha-amylase
MPGRKPSTLPSDRHWYRDAVIYQLHVKSFFDSNNDGVGDFPGLIRRLDYLAELGINAIWLLPFYPSPRRDDGYDISDYRGVHPEYGTIGDVRSFISEAHARGIRVITELVINHTSDQHPWFQKARRAKPGSAARDFYVWSDTDKNYGGTRIIFLDTEKSNWTWDEEAKAYYWHRFYSHQPDLNFDNPQVLKAVLSVMRFWLDMGVDGLRLDAVPYLVEREGTSNENLPETHAILKHIRKVVDEHYPDRMLLAEANQWPEDIQEYFGAGDECHMVFHFPLMPRMYMAIAQEDRFPITDIIRQTPDAPDGCQWAIFLRNHDELTLEMVTDRERDYLWEVYAADRRARLNLGIRRRLGPLLENDRRRIELMNSLLLTMPGTPIIYYGDEIGMGDNFHLGDRDGVRTPMQWSSDRNGGFSRADPASLVLPPIMDPIWGYEAVNVEAQWRNPHSLLNWLRHMLVERSRHQAFGRGTLRLLQPQNRKVLAYLREYEGDTILCVVNVSRSAQAVELDLNEFAGRTPIELLGGTPFPPIGQLTYMLTLPPYGFYWFKLSKDAPAPVWSTAMTGPFIEHQTFVLRSNLAQSLDHRTKEVLERDILPVYVRGRRWFQHEGADIHEIRILTAAPMPGMEDDVALVDLEVTIQGEKICYALPMAIAWEDVSPSPFEAPLAFARARRARRVGLLTDGFASASFARALIEGFARREMISFGRGEIEFLPFGDAAANIPADSPIEWPSAEQTNSSLIVGRQAIVKLIRRVVRGIHPEAEMTRALTERGFTGTPALIGEAVRRHASGETSALAIVETYIANQGDGAGWMHEQLTRIIDEYAVAPMEEGIDVFESIWSFVRAFGRRTGEMHNILAQPSDDPAFAPEIVDDANVKTACASARDQLKAALKCLLRTEDKKRRHLVAQLAVRRDETLDMLAKLLARGIGSLRTRIHGDLDLGHVLVCGNDASIINFGGGVFRSLRERRMKRSPMRDVASVLRSFDYAAGVIEREYKFAAAAPGHARASELLTDFRRCAERNFLEAYGEGRNAGLEDAERDAIRAFCIEKAASEIVYETNNRPDWVDLPLDGLAGLFQRGSEIVSG